MNENLHKLFEYYINNQAEFVEKYNSKSIILKDFEVVGVFDNEYEAAKNALEKYPPGTFIVQQVEPGIDSYTVTIGSNFVYSGD